jgi:hypothetical protein
MQKLFIIHLLTVSSLFYVDARACRYLLRVFYALPAVQEMRSKNAKLSRATT